MKVKKDEILNLLKTLIKTHTHASSPSSIEKAFNIIWHWFNTNELNKYWNIKIIYGSDKSKPPLLWIYPKKGDPTILLSGHIDTVFPEFWEPFKWEDEENIYGPGAGDMKGGIVVILYTLLRLKSEMPHLTKFVQVLLSGDEEIGFPYLRRKRGEIYKKSQIAFVYEGVPRNYGIVTQRKGILQMTITKRTEGGHAGNHIYEQENAIDSLINFIMNLKNKFHSEESQVSVNIGRIEGGIAPNIIAPFATAQLDIRTFSLKMLQEIRKYLRNKSKNKFLVTENLYIPPFQENAPGTEMIFQIITNVWGKYYPEVQNLKVKRGGGSEANLIAQYCKHVFDGFGPRGFFSHSKKEYVVKQSIFKHINLSVDIIKSLLTKNNIRI